MPTWKPKLYRAALGVAVMSSTAALSARAAPPVGLSNGYPNGAPDPRGVAADGRAAPPVRPLDPTADPPQGEPIPVAREYDRFQDKTTLRVEGVRPIITKGPTRLFVNATCSCDGERVTTKPQKVQINLLAVSDDFQYAEIKDELQLILLVTTDPNLAAAAAVRAATPPSGFPVQPAVQPQVPAQPQQSPPPQPPLPAMVGGAKAPARAASATTKPDPGVHRVRVPARFLKAGSTRDRNSRCLESFVAIVDADVLAQMATAPLVEGQLGGCEFRLGPMEQLSFRRLAEQVNLVAPLPTPDATALDGALANGPVRADAVALHLAQAKVDAAQEKVDQLTSTVYEQLDKNKEYKAAAAAAAELELKKDQTPAGPARASISQEWLEAKAKVGLLKSSALLEDPELTVAKRDLADAQSELHALQRALERNGGGGLGTRDARR